MSDAYVNRLESYITAKNMLPACFQERLDGFEARNPDFLRRFGLIELYSCLQADAIAEAVGSADSIPAYWAMPKPEQLAMTPGLDPDITIHAFQQAVNLAYMALHDPEMAPKLHGALCGVFGCREYGCYATEGA
jgi:hypothetical protein